VDNASGAAAVMEMAHVFSRHKPKGITVQFILFTGEEQGCLGSKNFVNNLTNANKQKIKFMLDLDMIGWDDKLQNLMEVETVPKYSNLAEIFFTSAQKFTKLPVSVSLNAWGSDHIPFINKNIPAVLSTNKDCTNYPDYHTTRDKASNVSSEVSENIIRMDIASLCQFIYNGVKPESLIIKFN